MAKRRLSRRREFLRRSGIATLTAVAEPGSRFGPRMEDYAQVETICSDAPMWFFSNLTYIYGVGPDVMAGVVQDGSRRPIRLAESGISLCWLRGEC